MNRIPKYVVRTYDQDGPTVTAWRGHATEKRAEAYRVKMNDSFQPGGANDHIRLKNGGIPHISRVDILTNDRYNSIVATARMPMFEVV